MTHFVLAIVLFLSPINHSWINLIGLLTVIFPCPQSGLKSKLFSGFVDLLHSQPDCEQTLKKGQKHLPCDHESSQYQFLLAFS